MEVVKKRRSIRRYRQDPVPEKLIEQVLEAARLAPSGGNRQPWHFVVVRDAETKRRLGLASWAAEAPVVIVVCTERDTPTDAAIAFEHILLAATDLGFGTCWMGLWGQDDKVRRTLGIPDGVRILGATPLGYPDEAPPPKPRKSLSQIVHYERF